MKKRRRRCIYYHDGYCFWDGDRGLVCDTDNFSHDGYCPEEESERELEEMERAIIEGMKEEK